MLFLVSSYQYILVAAVFSIGPPYRKPMWTNGMWLSQRKLRDAKRTDPSVNVGWLMSAILILSGFSTVLLLSPPQSMVVLLELMPLPSQAKWTLLGVVALNVLLCAGFERFASAKIARILRQARIRSRVKSGALYKAVDEAL